MISCFYRRPITALCAAFSVLALGVSVIFWPVSFVCTTASTLNLYDGPWKVEPWCSLSIDISYGKIAFGIIRAGYMVRDYNLDELRSMRDFGKGATPQPRIEIKDLVQWFDREHRAKAADRALNNLTAFHFFHGPIRFQDEGHSFVSHSTEIVVPIWCVTFASALTAWMSFRIMKRLGFPKRTFLDEGVQKSVG